MTQNSIDDTSQNLLADGSVRDPDAEKKAGLRDRKNKRFEGGPARGLSKEAIAEEVFSASGGGTADSSVQIVTPSPPAAVEPPPLVTLTSSSSESLEGEAADGPRQEAVSPTKTVMVNLERLSPKVKEKFLRKPAAPSGLAVEPVVERREEEEEEGEGEKVGLEEEEEEEQSQEVIESSQDTSLHDESQG